MAENYSVDCCLGGGADDSGFSSPGFCYETNGVNGSPENALKSESGRRGRPKAAMITSLMKEGAVSRSGIRCEICSRVFPRDKSLQAHLRVHTGERPYSCDYPGCVRKFKQSGQLKTHQRLHTGERPFLCSSSGCKNRFTHANRHCSSHPGAALIRSDDFLPYNPDTAQSEDVRLWLIRYMTEKKEPKSEKKSSKRSDGGSEGIGEEAISTELSDISNLHHGISGGGASELADMTNLQHTTAATPECAVGGLQQGCSSPLRHHHSLRSPIRTMNQRTPLHDLLRSPVGGGGQRTPVRDYLRSSPGNRTVGLRTPLHELLRSPVSFDIYSPGTVTLARYPPYSGARYDDVECSEAEDACLAYSTPLPTSRPAVKSLFADTPSPMLSPRKRELPKKRWLRIARREEESSANSRRPTVLRYLPASDCYSTCRPLLNDSTPCRLSTLLTESSTTPCQSLSMDSGIISTPSEPAFITGSPLLSRLLTMPHSVGYEEDPLAVPLPHD